MCSSGLLGPFPQWDRQRSCRSNLPSSSSIYCAHAMSISLDVIVYLHCHKQCKDCGGSTGLGCSSLIPCLSPFPYYLCKFKQVTSSL